MTEDLKLVYQFILENLQISPDAKIELAYPISIGERELEVNLAIESRDTLVLVEFKHRINEEAIFRIYAISRLLDKQVLDNKKIRLICAGKSLKYSVQEIANRLGVETLLIPPKLYQNLSSVGTISEASGSFKHLKASSSRLTSEKAWKIVCYLLTETPRNILSVSKKTGVSYGWTNTIIHELENAGMITMDYGIRIKDIDKLLNLVSWERALEGIRLETINTDFITATQCISEIALNLNRLGVDYAFTAHSSAVLYGSSIMREDTAYIYLPNPSDRQYVKSFSVRETGGCRLKVYAPERDIMKSSVMVNGIRIVDICQNILDLAGLGMDGRIAAKDLVNKVGK